MFLILFGNLNMGFSEDKCQGFYVPHLFIKRPAKIFIQQTATKKLWEVKCPLKSSDDFNPYFSGSSHCDILLGQKFSFPHRQQEVYSIDFLEQKQK